MKRHPLKNSATILVVCALSLTPWLGEAQTKVKPGYNMFSPEQDVEIGRKSAQEAESQLPMLNDREIEEYVDNIGKRLATHAPGPKFPYQFKVVNASDLNAFALPGGFLYVNRGTIEAAKTESELAGVLAHEIAHSALRHGTHNASKAYMTQAGLGILGGLLGGKVSPNMGQIINLVGGFGLNALFLKYSREAEKQADLIGVQMLAGAGYDTKGMVSFFQTLANSDKRRVANWMSSHPAPERRIEAIQKEAALLNATPSYAGSGQLTRVQARLRDMPAARTLEQIAQSRPPAGGTRGPSTGSGGGTVGRVQVEPPAQSMRTYTDPQRVYQIKHPANWRAYEGTGLGVTLAPEGGVVDVGGRAEVVYGALINHYEPFGEQSRGSRLYGSGGGSSRQNVTLESATDDLLKQITQASPHLKLVRGSGRRFQLADGTALGATLRGDSPTTRLTERVTVVTRQMHDDHLIYLLFITPEAEAQAYAGVLNAMVNSLQIDEDRDHRR